VAKDSTNKRLIGRLQQAIRDQTSQERFASEGFRWIEGSQTKPGNDGGASAP
jgi:hypothetical protein